MSDLVSEFDAVYLNALTDVRRLDIAGDAATNAVKNLRVLSECRILPVPEPEAVPEPPTTVLGKLKAGASTIWDNETTRVFIKAGGAFAGVGLVVWSTIHKDQLIQRDAMSQANQRNS